MLKVPLVTSTTSLTIAAFWDAVMLYHDRPHLVNRKLTAASQMLFHKICFNTKSVNLISEIFTRSALLHEMRKLQTVSKETISDLIRNIVECYDKNVILRSFSEDEFKQELGGLYISVRLLLPRNKHLQKCVEIVILDKEDKNSAIFLAVSENIEVTSAPPFPYELECTAVSNFRINVSSFEDADTAPAEWIVDKLFPKLLKWAEFQFDENKSVHSLSLLPVDEYCMTYSQLKQKYGDNLLREWPKKTKTNPQKYIFEDLAIASYLICLWKKYEKSDISFVDCGCGNGLLVYVLNQEGYDGYGIDVRKRAVWDIYPKATKLEVGTVTTTSLFLKSTWLIGNHSDELTPWIPVIALRSSFETNFFVLPCCPYDFSGQKYSRSNTSVSQYSDYLGYIREISVRCGFITNIDKLRIPSTKRTCLVGVKRKMNDEDLARVRSEIDKFIASRSSRTFVPRSSIEKVRNCTQLDKGIIQNLIYLCVNILLARENIVIKENGDVWNWGSIMSLSELSRQIPSEELKQLKSECGGLQTLLRNHRYIFEIIKGAVKLRQPLKLNEDTKRFRNKPCWFLSNHPNGCLYSAEECASAH